MHHDLFFGEVRFGPLVVVGVAAELGSSIKGQKAWRVRRMMRGGRGVGGHAPIPAAHQVGGLLEAGIGVAPLRSMA